MPRDKPDIMLTDVKGTCSLTDISVPTDTNEAKKQTENF